MRKAHFPKEGYIFQHKTETELFSRELYLAEGESLDDWCEITEEEYEAKELRVTEVCYGGLA